MSCSGPSGGWFGFGLTHLCVRPAEIRYDLTLDALRAKARASFIKADRRISKTLHIRSREIRCVNETFMMEVSSARAEGQLSSRSEENKQLRPLIREPGQEFVAADFSD